MAETSLNTETTTMDPFPEDSPMDMGDLSREGEAENPCEDEEPENKIPCPQVNQER